MFKEVLETKEMIKILEHQEGRSYNGKSKYIDNFNRLSFSLVS